ncbi:MAG: CFI-box-CTERM domain-containing protein [Acutalibacteraceae bacterium]|nr:CFI-box-CTERM domain-containing protein [Acutalibacteraceae bacterium]
MLAIKLVRDLTGFGLEKCKNFIENIDSLDLHNPQDLTQFTSNRNATTTRNTNTSANIQSTKSGGCYVATAVYGSYDCPQVWTLRRYRDNTLAKTWYGRLFIRTYYAISPTFVKWFGNTKLFKRILQSKLDRMVAKLQENGVESTFYEDKNW